MAELICECPLTRGERILVAVDGSDFSDAAVDQAISLGGICNSEIFAISVVLVTVVVVLVIVVIVDIIISWKASEHICVMHNCAVLCKCFP